MDLGSGIRDWESGIGDLGSEIGDRGSEIRDRGSGIRDQDYKANVHKVDHATLGSLTSMNGQG